ncbi:Gfo/Idh/MocA family oxidoreductase [Aquamicrobium sp. NLF2-7]|uniref:Gfo/Idh/MocA family oxidoreductase n=1 Tax=Aquamicrobium sp. NLF2-7 TaxID=2918753 RepID=UPI001EFA425D|nr:Gfo/Idh/MocA family oxidoreductase [Aquamicrobium sp. NLF2-7]MCG8273060.1 Gfo/Idh/MocA family oxidoreductase [Aquamicrobium sp. NLF2-7]
MTLRLGILGLSPGNGHPYSWSAICNGYDPAAMADCGFPVIPEYLARRNWPEDRIPGVRVTHVWTQDRAVSDRVARAALIDTVVARPEEMIGGIDALLLARDDAQNHRPLVEAFLRAGVPVYIDKPVALSEVEFDELHALQTRPGQIFSCSALRFAPEMQLDAETAERIGQIRLIQGMTPKYWTTYAMHLVDPVLAMLGYEAMPERLFSGPVGTDGRFLALRWPQGGPDVHLTAVGSDVLSPLLLRVVGDEGEITLTFSDSFRAFKLALMEFVTGVREGYSRLPEAFNRRAVQIIEMGIE